MSINDINAIALLVGTVVGTVYGILQIIDWVRKRRKPTARPVKLVPITSNGLGDGVVVPGPYRITSLCMLALLGAAFFLMAVDESMKIPTPQPSWLPEFPMWLWKIELSVLMGIAVSFVFMTLLDFAFILTPVDETTAKKSREKPFTVKARLVVILILFLFGASVPWGIPLVARILPGK